MNTISPKKQIKKILLDMIPKQKINNLPMKWEKIGDILIFDLDEELESYKNEIGKTYADILGCKSVLNDTGGIKGELREPSFELIFGDDNTETIHKENGVKYKLDPIKIMFSSGNMDERIRMSNIIKQGETIVDMFAGIGYFSLPIAVHCTPDKIFAAEKNPVSYNYLCENIVLNHVSSIVNPIKGDNREVCPKNVADRVIMGYIGGTKNFLETCFECLKNNRGFIHFHEKYPLEDVPEKPLDQIKKTADKFNRNVKLLECIHVKSYAPKIGHYVLDVKVE